MQTIYPNYVLLTTSVEQRTDVTSRDHNSLCCRNAVLCWAEDPKKTAPACRPVHAHVGVTSSAEQAQLGLSVSALERSPRTVPCTLQNYFS